MPSAAIHQSVAMIVNKKIKLEPSLFMLGSVAPDCWRHSEFHNNKKRSHFIFEETKIPNYNDFAQKYSNHLDQPFVVGYLVHLMTDSYWHLYVRPKYEFVLNGEMVIKMKDGTLFKGDACGRELFLYKNNRKVIPNIIEKYDISNLESLEEMPSFKNCINELDLSGINYTIKYINEVNSKKEEGCSLVYDAEDVCGDIEKCAEFVILELERFINISV